MIIPNSSYELNIILLYKTEQPMLNVPDYQLWLYFDCDDKDSDKNYKTYDAKYSRGNNKQPVSIN